MSLTATATALALLRLGPAPVAPAPAEQPLDEKERALIEQTDNVRLSLPTESDVQAWATPGLRLQLGYGYGHIFGSAPAWSFGSHSVILRPSVRIDPRWSIGVGLLYGTGPKGLRWSVTAEPTFQIWRRLALTVGLGYGGLSISDPSAPSGRLRGPDEVVSRDLADDERLQSCTGSALASLLRAEYLFIAGPLFATGPYVQLSAQWTRCQATFGRVDAETGRPIVLSQWWQQEGATLGWWFAWR
jgi:hypothetical protein